MAFISSQKSFWKAAKNGDMKELEYCLTYNIGNFDKDRPDGDGNTALSLAASYGQLPALARLIQDGCVLDTQNNENESALQAAVSSQHTAVALLLIEKGANVNLHDARYLYPIHNAAFQGDSDVVKALIAAKAGLDVQILDSGRTALHWAVENEFAPVIRALIDAGANPDIAAKDGKTPRDLAKDKAKPHLLEFFATTAAPVIAIVAAANQNAPVITLQTTEDDTAESWKRSGANRLTHIGTYPEINRRITEIFNFETRERTVIAENLKTGADTLTPPESFDSISEDALRRALKEFSTQGGTANEAFVLGNRPKRTFEL